MSYELSGTARSGRNRRAKTRVRIRGVYRIDPRTGLAQNPGLGFSFDPVGWATAIQGKANQVTTGLETIAGKIQSVKTRLNTGFDAVTGFVNTGGQVVQAASRSAIATAATGDAGTGLAAASASTPTILILGGAALAFFVFTRHPGKRGL